MIVLSAFLWNYSSINRHLLAMAHHHAVGVFGLIQDARLWNSSHGGIYVPVTKETHPNPYLDVPNRDIVTKDGMKLTLINPAYMTRQMTELASKQSGTIFHITSLKPIRPENRPDEWEAKALRAMEQGKSEYMEKISEGDSTVFRYMASLRMKEPCMKCHAKHGYKIGDLRGGISVTIPGKKLYESIKPQIANIIYMHLIVLFAGAFAVIFFMKRLRTQWFELQRLNEEQESAIEEGLKGLRAANAVLAAEISDRKKAEEALREREEKYRRIINTTSEGFWELDENSATVDVNDSLCKMLQYSRDEMLGRTPGEFADEDNKKIFKEQISKRGIIPHRNYTITLKTKEGNDVYTRFHASDLTDKHGNLTGSFAFISDITDMMQIEGSLAKYTIELERSNKELQDFAYIASHDLQEPLRKIVAFLDRLKTVDYDILSPRGKDYVERVMRAAERMQNLINDLLQYSRITTKAQPFEKINLVETVQEAMINLEARINETHGTVAIGDLPVIQADRLQMQQLFQNLIGNALKFRHPERSPLIKIQSRRLDNSFYEITVEDNGIGFDEKYIDRLFKPFQRLHARNEYEGTGMGLAICKKIVERHGGEIRAEGKPDKTSFFIITLPERQGKE